MCNLRLEVHNACLRMDAIKSGHNNYIVLMVVGGISFKSHEEASFRVGYITSMILTWYCCFCGL